MVVIVVLGGSYAALMISHRLLMNISTTQKDFKVIMISPSHHLYWNIASPRAMIPEQIEDNQIFQDFLPGFAKYPSTSFEFKKGLATNVDVAAQVVEITASDRIETQAYDHLIVATGSSCPDNVPWKIGNEYEETVSRLHTIQSKIASAATIMIGGGGPTAIETAGELGYEYGKTKEITVLTSGEHLLSRCLPSMGTDAENQLTKMNVKVMRNKRVASHSTDESGRTILKFTDGSSATTDLYIPAVGMTPNTSFLPKHLLNSHGHIGVEKTLAVKGVENVWAVGDVTQIERSLLKALDKQSKLVVKNLGLVLRGKAPVEYQPGLDGIALSVGPKHHVGQLGSWRVPSFLIQLVKGSDLGLNWLPRLATGQGY